MRHARPVRVRQQIQFHRRQFAHDNRLPFSDVLTEDLITKTLDVLSVFWVERIYSPLVTLWVFLSQVLSADHSCRGAVTEADRKSVV